jgi:hypothetical protein
MRPMIGPRNLLRPCVFTEEEVQEGRQMALHTYSSVRI